MYSPAVIGRNLEKAVIGLRSKLNDPTFQYVYHSPQTVAQANAHFAELLSHDDKGNAYQKRPYRTEETRWIANERDLCRYDFEYFRSRYAKIRDIAGNIVLATPTIAQRIKNTLRAEAEERGLGIDEQCLKARQLGISVDSELCVAHRAIFYSNVNAVVASSDPDKSEKMAGMIDLCFSELPYFMKPTVTESRAGKLLGFGLQNSYITIEHGTQFTGIARGTTPDVVHLSECSEFDNANELIDASLRPALHHTPMMFFVMESTAKGMRNWWHKEWLKNKDLWPRGMATTRPIFLPWHIGTDMWPTKTWLRQCPIPSNYRPSDEVIRHAEKCRTYVLSNDLLRNHLGSNWLLPLHQMWFYECKLEEARRKNTLNKWLEEMPADDMEAFQHTGAGVFSVELIQQYRDRIREPLGVYKLQAPVAEVPLLLQPTAGEIDHNKPPIEIRCQWNTDRPPYDYRLVPVKWNGYQEDSGLDKIYIWEYPKDNVEYVAGSDGAAGIGLDRTTIGIDKRALPGRPYALCAEFASDKTNAVDAWPLLLALGTYYSTKQQNERRQIMCVCEVMSETDLTQLELRKRGWWNFPEWGRIDQRDMSQTSHRYGWHTTPWSRRQIIAWLISLVRNLDIDIPSPFLVEEIADLMGDEESQKIKAVHGGHDDRVLRIAFTFFASHYKVIMDGTWSLDGARRFNQKNPPQLSKYVPSLAERCLTEDEEKVMGLIGDYERHGFGVDRYGY